MRGMRSPATLWLMLALATFVPTSFGFAQQSTTVDAPVATVPAAAPQQAAPTDAQTPSEIETTPRKRSCSDTDRQRQQTAAGFVAMVDVPERRHSGQSDHDRSGLRISCHLDDFLAKSLGFLTATARRERCSASFCQNLDRGSSLRRAAKETSMLLAAAMHEIELSVESGSDHGIFERIASSFGDVLR